MNKEQIIKENLECGVFIHIEKEVKGVEKCENLSLWID